MRSNKINKNAAIFPIQNLYATDRKKRLMIMEIRQIRYFIAIAEREHFSRASEFLNVAQSALSRQMKMLEDELGVELFERLPRGIRLTPAGQFFLDEARAILKQIAGSTTRTKAAALGRVGRLRLGVIEMGAWQGLIPDSLRRFRETINEVELELSVLSSPSQIEALRARKLDAGILYYPPKEAGFIAIPLIRHAVMIALPADNPLTQNSEIKLHDLAQERFIGFRREVSPQFHDEIHVECRSKEFHPNFINESSCEADMLALVSAGAGVCFVNACQRWREPYSVCIRPLVNFNVHLELNYVFPMEGTQLPVHHYRTVLEETLEHHL